MGVCNIWNYVVYIYVWPIVLKGSPLTMSWNQISDNCLLHKLEYCLYLVVYTWYHMCHTWQSSYSLMLDVTSLPIILFSFCVYLSIIYIVYKNGWQTWNSLWPWSYRALRNVGNLRIDRNGATGWGYIANNMFFYIDIYFL